TAQQVGFPEARIPLAFTVIDLALSPKSKSGIYSIDKALEVVNQKVIEVPYYLRLTPHNINPEAMFPYDRSDLWSLIQYLPDELKNNLFYTFDKTGNYEKALIEHYHNLLKVKRSNDITTLRKTKPNT
ncbi:MAG: hypothetical protein LBM99_04955, partial [Bacillales bacterium]|nr:hypothetical protein [Bacillales bacterium]